jgi:hypothetical protein
MTPQHWKSHHSMSVLMPAYTVMQPNADKR